MTCNIEMKRLLELVQNGKTRTNEYKNLFFKLYGYPEKRKELEKISAKVLTSTS